MTIPAFQQCGVTKSAAADSANHAIVFAPTEIPNPAYGRAFFRVALSGAGTAFVNVNGVAATSADTPVTAGMPVFIAMPASFQAGGTVNVNSGDTPSGNIYVTPVTSAIN